MEGIGASEGEVAAIFGCSCLGGFISPTLIEIIVFRDDIEHTDIISTHVVEMVEKVKYIPVEKPPVNDKVVVLEGEADLTTFCDDDNEKEKHHSPTPPTDNNHNHNYKGISVPDHDGTTDGVQSSPLSAKSTSSPLQKTESPFLFNRIVISVICGDFLHNFCDGIFIGVAVRSCSFSIMWTIIAVTMFHEFAQEISDFVILTQVGLSIPHALTLNALGGFSVILGGIFTSSLDLSDVMIGIFLAYGSGNLIYLACSELFPLLHVPPTGKTKLSRMDKLRGICCFCVGAFVIGLTLLRHEHCEAGGEEGGDGHGH